MQNINKNMIRKSIVMDIWDFTELVGRLTGIDADYDLDGLSFNGEKTKVYEALSEYFGVRVTSVHTDDCAPIGVWITYKDTKKDKVQAFREEISREAVICFAAADYITEHMAGGSAPYDADNLPEPLSKLDDINLSDYSPNGNKLETGKCLYLAYGNVSVAMHINITDGKYVLSNINIFMLYAPVTGVPIIMAADTDLFAERFLELTEAGMKAFG